MSNLLASVQSDRFRSTLRACAAQYDLQFDTLKDDFASMIISRESGGPQLLLFGMYGSTVEFLGLTDLTFDTIDEVPDFLSTHLLVANQHTKLGFWAIREIADKHRYAVIYNIELNLLTPKLFGNVILDIGNKVDEMYAMISALDDSLA